MCMNDFSLCTCGCLRIHVCAVGDLRTPSGILQVHLFFFERQDLSLARTSAVGCPRWPAGSRDTHASAFWALTLLSCTITMASSVQWVVKWPRTLLTGLFLHSEGNISFISNMKCISYILIKLYVCEVVPPQIILQMGWKKRETK